MQQAAAPWGMKTLPVLRTHLRDHPTRLAASTGTPSFHSTPASFAKWKDKWDCPKVRLLPTSTPLLHFSLVLQNPHLVRQGQAEIMMRQSTIALIVMNSGFFTHHVPNVRQSCNQLKTGTLITYMLIPPDKVVLDFFQTKHLHCTGCFQT
jgi:hypothetical protein